MFLTPEHLIECMNLKPGSTVADVGSGSGAYTIALARTVGEAGKVYAVDLHKDLLETLKSSLDRAGYLNTDIIWANIEEGVYLDSYSLDAVVLSNVLFMIEDKDKALKEISRLLVPHGLLLVVDWSHKRGGVGPHPDHIVTEGEAEKLLVRHGFTIKSRLPAGEFHYAILATN